MAAIQALKKAKSLAPASGILPPEAAEGIIKTNASPHGLTFCHKVIRTVPEISGSIYSYLKPTRWLMPQSTALSR